MLDKVFFNIKKRSFIYKRIIYLINDIILFNINILNEKKYSSNFLNNFFSSKKKC